jgi:uncharacterized protein YbaR (Trm112 family)
VKLDPVLMEILVCPVCKSELRADDANDELICTGCGLVYPVRGDIPVMLVEEARRPDASSSPDDSAGSTTGSDDSAAT